MAYALDVSDAGEIADIADLIGVIEKEEISIIVRQAN